MAKKPAGKMDRRITIQGLGTTRHPNGEDVQSWTDVKSVWAEKVEDIGQERFTSDQFVGKTARSFRFRWSQELSNINSKNRIVYGGVVHQIVNLREIGRRDLIEVDVFSRSEEGLG